VNEDDTVIEIALVMNPERNERTSPPSTGLSKEEPYSMVGSSSGLYSSVRPTRLTGDSINKDQ
jgi:hypothetical protein